MCCDATAFIRCKSKGSVWMALTKQYKIIFRKRRSFGYAVSLSLPTTPRRTTLTKLSHFLIREKLKMPKMRKNVFLKKGSVFQGHSFTAFL
jgi:hypothetical protein